MLPCSPHQARRLEREKGFLPASCARSLSSLSPQAADSESCAGEGGGGVCLCWVAFPGPRFGTAGLRKLVGVPTGALIQTALKPQVRLCACALCPAE